MNCPKCDSSLTIEISTTFPRVYECRKCNFVFSFTMNPFMDE
ncbi:MAG: hypothetical protein N3D78_01415 [Candidatus Aenigmarchaeota archaeon]|nr:hypothetical protein [Candidatus Aenigmarchaeota archaeon]